MLEFKGTYFQRMKSKATVVLVQYDGVLLHVWHLSEPFCRLFSSDVFQICAPLFTAHQIIKLPNGGRIETDNGRALEELSAMHHTISEQEASRSERFWTITLIVMMVLLVVLLC
ncbi:MAG: hypothetical protein HKP58_08435 [Desulfatitalea sp.]|nr:hypothetical protein [Desulfatitalea sp.]NNK00428.1 hypothetical protein [Desulfatitalea sp.]